MSGGDVHLGYGYLLGIVNLVRREVRGGGDPRAVVEAVEELVYCERVSEMLREFNLE